MPNLSAYFLSDDFVLLSWTRVASPEEVAAFFDPRTFWFYRPIVKVVYWLGQSLFGLQAVPFHLFSLLLHGANAYLLYRLVSRPAGVRWVAGLAAALIFLLNPRHAETVSWIAAVGDLLAAFCMLAALLLFQHYYEEGATLPLASSAALFALGLLSRETAVMLPALLVLFMLVLRWGQGRQGGLALAPRLSRLFIALGVYGVMLLGYLLVQLAGGDGGQGPVERGGLQFRALNLDSILLGILDYVHGLVPGGALLAQQPLDTLRVLVWVEWAAIVALAVVLWRAGQRLMLLGLVWLLSTPLLFIFFSGPSDRYFYLPSIGYSIFVAGLLTGLPGFLLNVRLPVVEKAVKVGVAFAAGVLLLFQGIGLSAEEAAWNEAGKATGRVFHDIRQAVPEPRDYSAFYFVGLPMFLDGVPTFQNAVQPGVQLVYDNPTIAASDVTCEYLEQQAELPRYSFFFRSKADGAEQFPSVQDCQ